MLISQAQALTWGTEEVKPVVVLSRMSMGWRQEQSPSGTHVISVESCSTLNHLCVVGAPSLGTFCLAFLHFLFSFWDYLLVFCSFSSFSQMFLDRVVCFCIMFWITAGQEVVDILFIPVLVCYPFFFLEPLLQPTKFTASFLLLFSSLLNSLLHPIPSPVALHFPLS